MSRRRNSGDSDSSGITKFLLTLVILGGLGYLAYTHQEEIKSFDYKSINLESLKRLVGLGEPETTNPDTTPHPQTTPPAPAPTTETTPSTNNGANPVPLVGRPRPPLPAHEHWTWTTTDGKTYQEVKVEKIQGDTVTFIHADGGASIPISTLPEDVQKELNYYSSQAQ